MDEYIFELLSKDTGLSRMEVQQAIAGLMEKGYLVEKNGKPIPALNGISVDEWNRHG
jgi:biotin operon repressor